MLTSPPAVLLGALTPRVEIRPADIVDTDGDLAADLMAAANKPLEQWQRDGVHLMMSTRPDGKWACYEYAEWVARQQGKGVLGETRVVYGLLVLDEEITWSAHLYGTALIAFRRIRDVFRALGTVHRTAREEVIEIDGVPIKVWNSNNERGFERQDTGRKLSFFARSKGGLRGASPDLNVIDEAFAYTFEHQDAIMPTLIAKPNAQIVYLSSPPLTGETGEVMYGLKERVEKGASRRLGYRDWGLEGNLDDIDRIDVDDRESWASTCPGLGRGRVTVETIQAMRDSMSRAGFGREVLGLWPKKRQGGGAIDPAQWASLFDPDSRRDGDIALGVDIAPNRDWASIALYGLRADEVGHGQLIDYRAGTDWIVPRLVELCEVLDPVAIGLGRGTAASLKPDLEKVGIAEPEDAGKPDRGDLVVIGGTDMAAACGHILDDVRQSAMRHIGQQQLAAAVAGAQTRQVGDSMAWSRKAAETDIAPLVALTAARWAYVTRVDAVKHEPQGFFASWR